MKKLKYSLGILFALIIISLAFAIPSFAVSESDFTVETVSGGVAITAYTGDEKAVTIPETIGSKKVVQINGFGSNTVESVVLPQYVTEIGEYAFENCGSLSSVKLNQNLQTIGWNAFSGTALETVTIPSKVTSMGGSNSAFENIPSLHTVIFETLKVPNYALYECSSIENVYVPNNATTIGESAFCACTSLTSLSNKLVNGEPVFENVINLPAKLTSIGSSAFRGCSGIESIEFPSLLTEIGEYAFKNCGSLSSVKLNQNLQTIGWNAFSGTALETVTIPSKVTSMGGSNSAFENIPSLHTVIFETLKVPNYALYECSSVEEVVIPVSVKEIGDYAFNGCTSMKISGYKYSYAWQYANENNIQFNQLGAIKGWFTYNGYRFYSLDNTKGALAKGWKDIKNSKGVSYRYYFNSKGVMLTGWQKIANSKGVEYKYYFHTNGVMLTGWQNIKAANGNTYKYYLNPSNGVMLTGWQSIKNAKGVAYKYYFGANGVMRTGWQSIKNAKGVAYKYYFGANGVMRTGWQWIANSKGVKYRYYFGANGVMRTGWQNIKAANGKTYKYYFYANGVNAINRNVKIGNKTYKFNKYGICTNA